MSNNRKKNKMLNFYKPKRVIWEYTKTTGPKKKGERRQIEKVGEDWSLFS